MYLNESLRQRGARLVTGFVLSFCLLLAMGAQMAAAADTGTITINTIVDPSDSTQEFFYYGDAGAFFHAHADSVSVTKTAPGTYNVFQDIPTGYALDITCDSGDTTVAENGKQVIITLAAGDDITCDFTNTYVAGTVTVVNASNGPATDSFSHYSRFGSFVLSPTASIVFTNVVPGDYDIYQTLLEGYLLDISCSNDTAVVVGSSNGVEFTVGNNEDVVCTFNNDYVANSITIVNADNGPQDTFNYYGSIPSEELSDGESFSAEKLLPGTYVMYQDIPAGYNLGIGCEGAESVIPAGTRGISVTVTAQQDVVCTFDNDYVGGSITIVTAGDDADETLFNYYGGTNVPEQTVGDSSMQGDLYPGSYNMQQNVPAGYVLDIECVGGDSQPLDTNGVTIMLDRNEDIVCTFTNTYVGGSLTIVNATTPADFGAFEYYGTTGFFNLSNGESDMAVDLYPGTYDMYQNIPAGIVLDISCTGENNTLTDNGQGVIIELGANEDVVCTFTNTDVGGSITIITAGNTDAPFLNYYGDTGFYTGTVGTSKLFDSLYPGTYGIFQDIPEDNTLSFDCNAEVEISADAKGVIITLVANQDVVCTYSTNKIVTDLIVNGDFELGSEGWTEYSRRGYDLIVDEEAYGGSVPAQSGDMFTWLGGDNRERSRITQYVELPSGTSATLNFSYWVASSDACGYDWGTVYVRDEMGNVYRVWTQKLCRHHNTNGWVNASVDMTRFAGQTVRISFRSFTDWSYVSSLFIDDIALLPGAPLTSRAVTGASHDEIVIDPTLTDAENFDNDATTQSETSGQDERNDENTGDETDERNSVPTAVTMSSTAAQGSESSLQTVATLMSVIILGLGTLHLAVRKEN